MLLAYGKPGGHDQYQAGSLHYSADQLTSLLTGSVKALMTLQVRSDRSMLIRATTGSCSKVHASRPVPPATSWLGKTLTGWNSQGR